jgi:hypothetical protein
LLLFFLGGRLAAADLRWGDRRLAVTERASKGRSAAAKPLFLFSFFLISALFFVSLFRLH